MRIPIPVILFIVCSFALCLGFRSSRLIGKPRRLIKMSFNTFNSQSTLNPLTIENSAVAFFEAWNSRDIEAAVSYFALNCVYEDSSFPNKFYGRTAVKKHLIKSDEGFPDGTIIKIDKVSGVGAPGANIGVQWHVECNGVHLPSARGCSMYTLDEEGLIAEGIDIFEPIPKVGELALKASKAIVTAGKLAQFYKPNK